MDVIECFPVHAIPLSVVRLALIGFDMTHEFVAELLATLMFEYLQIVDLGHIDDSKTAALAAELVSTDPN